MYIKTRLAISLFSLLLAILYRKYKENVSPLPIPILDLEQYWGAGEKPDDYSANKTIELVKIIYHEDYIDDLRSRLQVLPEFPAPLEGVGFEYGFNSNYLTKVLNYWKNDYLPRYRSREIRLNAFPHFSTEIQGLSIHYIHAKPNFKKGNKVIPIILLHGWPGSVIEFYDIIPKLVMEDDEKNGYVFEVIVPSLPGYGWSQSAAKPGLGAIEVSVVLRNLMLRLGHEKFYVQGGDWGSIIGRSMATLFPENVLGYHSNLCGITTPLAMTKSFIASKFPSYFMEPKYYDWFYPKSDKFLWLIEEMGYFHIQATKPDTIGAVLTGNPAGLAAYILEKFSTWTNANYKFLEDGGLEKDYELDILLDNVMVYYLTNSITTSQRLYAESFNLKQMAIQIDRVPVTVPVGCARFRYDLGHSLDWELKDKFPKLIHSTWHDHGGHFAALELPDVLYSDLIEFVNKAERL